jgi:hypothetical protein
MGIKISMQMASLGTFALMSLAAGCGGASAVDAKAAAPQSTQVHEAVTSQAREAVVMGPTEGASSDPIILGWQNDLLRAVGREGQHTLFSLVLIETGESKGAGPTAYLAFDAERLGMTSAERTAANAVQEYYAGSPIRATTRANLWVAPLVHDGASGSTASR